LTPAPQEKSKVANVAKEKLHRKVKQPSSKPKNVKQAPLKSLNNDNFRNLLKPRSGAKNAGGKEIQKVENFDQWLDKEYQNKQSQTYVAYRSLAQSEGLNGALFVGIRGDGDCGFRAMIVSMFLELAKDPQFKTKLPLFIEQLNAVVERYHQTIPGFDNLNCQCLQKLNLVRTPKELVELLNDDAMVGDLTRVFRFLSNAILIQEFDHLPEEVRMQIEYSEGAMDLGLVPFLHAHANLDVANVNQVPAYLFAGIAQVWALADRLGVGYRIGIVDEGNPKPQEANEYIPEGSWLRFNLLCRDTRHFDVILK
jgi:hypothetical protein